MPGPAANPGSQAAMAFGPVEADGHLVVTGTPARCGFGERRACASGHRIVVADGQLPVGHATSVTAFAPT
jgi:hypothetical protein